MGWGRGGEAAVSAETTLLLLAGPITQLSSFTGPLLVRREGERSHWVKRTCYGVERMLSPSNPSFTRMDLLNSSHQLDQPENKGGEKQSNSHLLVTVSGLGVKGQTSNE